MKSKSKKHPTHQQHEQKAENKQKIGVSILFNFMQ
jgi:hypothetical protein